jgi:ankyrin repeat protein
MVLRYGSDVKAVDKNGNISLHTAAPLGIIEIVQFLISRGADVNAKNNAGNTPLHWVVTTSRDAKNVEVIKLLISAGANVNVKNDNLGGKTPLHMAAENSNTEVVKLLISAGADVNAESRTGTPLHRAADDGNIEVAKILISHGADVNAKISDTLSQTPLDCAGSSVKNRENGAVRAEMEKYLKSEGAKSGLTETMFDNLRNNPIFQPRR